MTAIGTLAQNNQILLNLQQLQTQADQLQQQISTGLTSQSFTGIAPNATQLLNLQSSVQQHQDFVDTINQLDTRQKTTDLALSSIQDLASQFAGLLPSGAYDTTQPGIAARAQQFLSTLAGYLDTNVGNTYIFSGAKTGTAPFDPSGLPNPADLSTTVGGNPPAGYYAGDGTVASARIDQNVTLNYGITGDNPAIENFVRVLNFFATQAGPLDPTSAADQTKVGQAVSLMNSAQNGLTALRTTLSLNTAQADSTSQYHQSIVTMGQTQIGNIENVDTTTAITQLNTLTTQLQASYQAVNELQRFSLVNFLPIG